MKKYSKKDQYSFLIPVKEKINLLEKEIISLYQEIESQTENQTADQNENSGNLFSIPEKFEKINKCKFLIIRLKSAELRITKYGTFGTCYKTGNLIKKERLSGDPSITTSVDVQIQLETNS